MKNTLIKHRNSLSLFDELAHSLWNEAWTDPLFGLTRNWRPETFIERDKDYLIEVELPRVKKDDIKVTAIDKNTIQIVARNDRVSYTRSFSTESLDAENSTLVLEDGVLKITIPKTSISPPNIKVLEIKS